MKKANPQIRWHLSEGEKKEIIRLSKDGLRVSDLARRLRLNPLTIVKWRKAAGLPSKQVLPEAKILKLLEDGVAPRTVARTLGLSYRNVSKFAWKNGYGKPRKELSDAQLLRLKADILAREGSAASLTKKYRCSYKTVLALAHSLLDTERFLPTWRNPLSSYFPSRAPETKLKKVADAPNVIELCVAIVQAAVKALDGKIPAREILVTALASRFAPLNPADAGFADVDAGVWEQARLNFIMALTIAVDCVTRDRNAQWTN